MKGTKQLKQQLPEDRDVQNGCHAQNFVTVVGFEGKQEDSHLYNNLLHQLHGGVAVDEEGLGVVAELQRLQPLGHRRGVVAIVADSTDPGQQPDGLQEALSVGRVEDPDLQQVLVLHHVATLQGNKREAKLGFMQHYYTHS
ncbi:hypothetical protein F7725_021650 [Dissostichus mawsoni]|uniref:Uncharacterized protein n=1 Tax=Dissostichus mawsoni TaxID=36200 RepID=A0A7J5ZDR0_DISMA|nr:hypothetical protein F7725_021650 [Dissostichus mawsoni]